MPVRSEPFQFLPILATILICISKPCFSSRSHCATVCPLREWFVRKLEHRQKLKSYFHKARFFSTIEAEGHPCRTRFASFRSRQTPTLRESVSTSTFSIMGPKRFELAEISTRVMLNSTKSFLMRISTIVLIVSPRKSRSVYEICSFDICSVDCQMSC
jgi:hypothetical protein